MQLRANVSSEEAFNRLNQFLCEKSSTSRFVTMFFFTLDAAGQGSYINAGHNTAYIFRGATGDIEEVPSNNLLVGAFSFASYESAPFQLEAIQDLRMGRSQTDDITIMIVERT